MSSLSKLYNISSDCFDGSIESNLKEKNRTDICFDISNYIYRNANIKFDEKTVKKQLNDKYITGDLRYFISKFFKKEFDINIDLFDDKNNELFDISCDLLSENLKKDDFKKLINVLKKKIKVNLLNHNDIKIFNDLIDQTVINPNNKTRFLDDLEKLAKDDSCSDFLFIITKNHLIKKQDQNVKIKDWVINYPYISENILGLELYSKVYHNDKLNIADVNYLDLLNCLKDLKLDYVNYIKYLILRLKIFVFFDYKEKDIQLAFKSLLYSIETAVPKEYKNLPKNVFFGLLEFFIKNFKKIYKNDTQILDVLIKHFPDDYRLNLINFYIKVNNHKLISEIKKFKRYRNYDKNLFLDIFEKISVEHKKDLVKRFFQVLPKEEAISSIKIYLKNLILRSRFSGFSFEKSDLRQFFCLLIKPCNFINNVNRSIASIDDDLTCIIVFMYLIFNYNDLIVLNNDLIKRYLNGIRILNKDMYIKKLKFIDYSLNYFISFSLKSDKKFDYLTVILDNLDNDQFKKLGNSIDNHIKNLIDQVYDDKSKLDIVLNILKKFQLNKKLKKIITKINYLK